MPSDFAIVKTMSKIILIAHDIRSSHNVGSILRTADCLGADMVYLTGYTPYPEIKGDDRLPHLAKKLTAQIHKTVLGAEISTKWTHNPDIKEVIGSLKSQEVLVVALEQSPKSKPLPEFRPQGDVALIVGNEVTGLETSVLDCVDQIIEIPMSGTKESLNVAQASAIGLYQLRWALQS
jgi:23S rRNA (guanosine2251-2'-O)-methyltransferase